jgi:hypothetical protein
LLQVRPDEAKYSVVGTERIVDGARGLTNRPRHPKIGAAGNGHHENLSHVQREMRARSSWASAMRPTAKRIFRRPVAAFRDPRQSFSAVAKPEGKGDLVQVRTA